MSKKVLITASALGGLSIVLGAFGAHALKALISVESQNSFEIGVRYQMYHALFLLFVAVVPNMSEKPKKTIACLVLLGVILFSGSIYLLSTNVLTAFNFKTIGFVTPIGGLLLIAAWIVLLVNVIKIRKSE
ncbi:DUF423 domain-containing protein [Tamlana crocina]|uniref:DUF423 domain-containing protein n=1 Tax=Tamlana crocina TaxID=393006 RepID=A0ABX1DC69_9FLAO|nr:DUF423 domain-containing protein [Tamlana crocina]NJX14902.1 DUF423 domain-containing protein [Tamlana crocina]